MFPTERVQTNLRKAVLEWCTLALLRAGDMYGRDLAVRLGDLGLTTGYGSIYGPLARMRDAGWVETRWVESPVGPPRRYYVITPDGADAVRGFERTWLNLSTAVDAALGSGPSHGNAKEQL